MGLTDRSLLDLSSDLLLLRFRLIGLERRGLGDSLLLTGGGLGDDLLRTGGGLRDTLRAGGGLAGDLRRAGGGLGVLLGFRRFGGAALSEDRLDCFTGEGLGLARRGDGEGLFF